MDISEIENLEEKKAVAEKILNKVKDGNVIGFGSGSTSYVTAIKIGELVTKDNLNITAIPTSKVVEDVCKEYKIKIGNLIENKIDWAFDGADEVDEKNMWLIKGRGAAMFKEKLNILASPITYILVDNSKFVNNLGEKCKVPIEVFPSAMNYVSEELKKLGAYEITYRGFTENNNGILDVKFNNIYEKLEKDIKQITGVIESGLFLGYKNLRIIK